MSDTDYREIHAPDDKRPTEYHWTERRAEILTLIEEAGHPDHLNQTQLAHRYGTTQSNISKDFKRLRTFIRDSLGSKRHTISETVYRKAVKAYMEDGEYDKAIDSLESWNDWLREEGVREVEPDKHDHDVNLAPDEALMQSLKSAYQTENGHTNGHTNDDGGGDGHPLSPEDIDGIAHPPDDE